MSAEATLLIESGTPEIRVWMTLDEAAETLSTSAEIVNLQAELGELEQRVGGKGDRQVLVPLARGRKTLKPDVAAIDFAPSEVTPRADFRPMSRHAQLAPPAAGRSPWRGRWAATGLVLAGLVGGGVMAVHQVRKAQSEAESAVGQLQHVSFTASRLMSDRDALQAQLSAAQTELRHKDEELSLERGVEDTLFKAAIASHATSANHAPALAEGN